MQMAQGAATPGGTPFPSQAVQIRRAGNRTRAVSLNRPGVTRPAPHPPHAGQVVCRVLLRRNIAVDAETAQLVAAAVQAALQPGAPSRRPAAARVFPAPAASRCPDHDRGVTVIPAACRGIAGAD